MAHLDIQMDNQGMIVLELMDEFGKPRLFFLYPEQVDHIPNAEDRGIDYYDSEMEENTDVRLNLKDAFSALLLHHFPELLTDPGASGFPWVVHHKRSRTKRDK